MSTLRAKQFHFVDDIDIAATTFVVIDRAESVVTKINNVFRTWVRRSNDRRMLAQMDERMLTDIGLTYYDVKLEADKYFWQK